MTKDFDPEKLLEKVNGGTALEPDEADYVTELLARTDVLDVGRTPSVDDVYSLLLVLGRARLFEHRMLLEKYLDFEDALTVALVLEILCLEWQLTGEYLERVISFSLSVPWDPDEDVRQISLKILGEYLYALQKEKEEEADLSSEEQAERLRRRENVLELLFSVFEDQDSESWTRRTAYSALCRASGWPWEQIPSDCQVIEFTAGSADVDWAMLEKLRGQISHASTVNS